MGLRDYSIGAALDEEHFGRIAQERLQREGLLRATERARQKLEVMFPDEEIVAGAEPGVLLVDDLKFKCVPSDGYPYLVLGVCEKCGLDIVKPVSSSVGVGYELLKFDRREVTCEHCKQKPESPVRICTLLPMFDAEIYRRCLRWDCALFEKTQEECSFLLLGRKAAFEFMEHDRRGE